MSTTTKQKTKMQKQTLEAKLAMLHSEEARFKLVNHLLSTHEIPKEYVESACEYYMASSHPVEATEILDEAGPERFPELCLKMARMIWSPEGEISGEHIVRYDKKTEDKIKKAMHYYKLGGDEKSARKIASMIITDILEDNQRLGLRNIWEKAAYYASEAGDYIKEAEIYLEWARQSLENFNKEKGHFNPDLLHSCFDLLEKESVLPEKTKKALRTDLVSKLIRKGVEPRTGRTGPYFYDYGGAVEKGILYGEIDTVLKIFEEEGLYDEAERAAEAAGLTKQAELYSKLSNEEKK